MSSAPSKQGDFKHDLDRLEESRQREYGKATALGIALGSVAASGIWLSDLSNMYSLPLFGTVAYATFQWQYSKWLRRTIPKFKRMLTTNYITEQFTDIQYEPEVKPDINLLERSHLFTGAFVGVHTEDEVTGSVDGVGFRLFELRMHTTMSEAAAVQPPFSGVFMQATFPRRLTDKIIIIPKRHITPAFKRNRESLIHSGYHRIELESDIFNEAFEVWCHDEIEARYALPIVFQERLIRLHVQLRAPVSMSIFEDQLYLAFESGYDLFEPDLDTLTSTENLVKAASQIKALKKLIQALGLRNPLAAPHVG